MEELLPKELLGFMKCFDKLFDIVRVVDPLSKEVIEYNNGIDSYSPSTCHDFWKKGKQCENCVSVRAYNESDTFVKIDYNKDKIYLVMASPGKMSNKRYIVEFIKDITNTGIIPNINGKSVEEINEIVIQLNKEVITDELTQCYNRRYLNERLGVDILNAIQNRTKLSVIMIDFDEFKEINDKLGHVGGDKALKEISHIIKKVIRMDSDWVARYGGDEFFIALPNADKEATIRIADRIRNKVENTIIEQNGVNMSTTISVGTYTMDSETVNIEQLIELVDKNLYLAKEKGKNNVISS